MRSIILASSRFDSAQPRTDRPSSSIIRRKFAASMARPSLRLGSVPPSRVLNIGLVSFILCAMSLLYSVAADTDLNVRVGRTRAAVSTFGAMMDWPAGFRRDVKGECQADAQVRTGGGGGGCFSTRSKPESRQAQVGALLAQMFIVGVTDDGSSKVPARTTVNCGRADELAKRCEPQRGQKRRLIWLPLSAVFANSLTFPEISSDSVGTTTFTVPLAAKC